MQKVSTITSKRQLTIPSRLFRAVGFKEGQRVLIEDKNGTIVVKSADGVVERLTGSVHVPARFALLEIEEIIRRAKKEYREGRI